MVLAASFLIFVLIPFMGAVTLLSYKKNILGFLLMPVFSIIVISTSLLYAIFSTSKEPMLIIFGMSIIVWIFPLLILEGLLVPIYFNFNKKK